MTHVTLAVFQTIVTSCCAGRPEPEIVVATPGLPMSGFVVRTPMFCAGFDAWAIGPGSGATPGSAGGVRACGVAEARAGRSSAPASTTPANATLRVHAGLRLVLMVLICLLAFGSVFRGGLSVLRDDRDLVVA